jgi:hypothetical protein
MKRQLKGLALEQYKATLPKFNQRQKNIIVGTLLGDSTLVGSKTLKPLYNIKFEQNPTNKPYVDSIYNEFYEWCGSSPQFYVKKESGIVKSYGFKTYGHRSFDFYANQFYNIDEKTGKRKKVVPKLIHRWLNEESLTYWFMDKGSKIYWFMDNGSKMRRSGYFLNTQGFTLSENEQLADALGKRFKFEVNIHKDNNKKTGKKGFRLYITAKSRDNFTQIVSPYIDSCFKYKLITQN